MNSEIYEITKPAKQMPKKNRLGLFKGLSRYPRFILPFLGSVLLVK